MGSPLQLTLNVYQGQTFNDTLTVQNADGTPVDLTGFVPSMTVRANLADPDPPLAFFSPTDATLVVSDAANGVLTFNVPVSETFSISLSNEQQVWCYGLRITSSAGVAQRVVEGAFVVYPSVDRLPTP